MNRRQFLGGSAAAVLGGCFAAASAVASESQQSDTTLAELLDRNRPSRLSHLPAGFCDRVGATHVAGRYHLTSTPFLLEGARKLLALGTRAGKFWLTPESMRRSYPFHSRWGEYPNLVSLARADDFQELLTLPFSTIAFEAHSPVENGWQRPGQPQSFYEGVRDEFHALTAHLYRVCRDRPITIILQNWEGDWLLRGRGGELWNPPPEDWPARCERMVKWLSARQAGVALARAEHGVGARCIVAHAAEVNRVADAWAGIPTMTSAVLPQVEVDLVSYSCYDGLRDPLTLWKCLAEIRKHARTGALFGPKAVMIGEIGIPENDQPRDVTERWDKWMGVLLAAEVKYVFQWELYCNEPSPRAAQRDADTLTDPKDLRGFWLVKPDGTLSETGRYFCGLWSRCVQEPGHPQPG